MSKENKSHSFEISRYELSLFTLKDRVLPVGIDFPPFLKGNKESAEKNTLINEGSGNNKKTPTR